MRPGIPSRRFFGQGAHIRVVQWVLGYARVRTTERIHPHGHASDEETRADERRVEGGGAMSIYIRLLPNVKVRLLRRGLRWSLGPTPRMAPAGRH